MGLSSNHPEGWVQGKSLGSFPPSQHMSHCGLGQSSGLLIKPPRRVGPVVPSPDRIRNFDFNRVGPSPNSQGRQYRVVRSSDRIHKWDYKVDPGPNRQGRQFRVVASPDGIHSYIYNIIYFCRQHTVVYVPALQQYRPPRTFSWRDTCIYIHMSKRIVISRYSSFDSRVVLIPRMWFVFTT